MEAQSRGAKHGKVVPVKPGQKVFYEKREQTAKRIQYNRKSNKALKILTAFGHQKSPH